QGDAGGGLIHVCDADREASLERESRLVSRADADRVGGLSLEMRSDGGRNPVARDRERRVVLAPRPGNEAVGRGVSRIGIAAEERPYEGADRLVLGDAAPGQRDVDGGLVYVRDADREVFLERESRLILRADADRVGGF